MTVDAHPRARRDSGTCVALLITQRRAGPTVSVSVRSSYVVSDGNRDGNDSSRQRPAATVNSHVASQNLTRTGHPLHLKNGRSTACPRCSSRLHRPVVGISRRVWTARGADDLHNVGIPPVIHFSTASPLHNYPVADQHVYLNHPQAYTQDVSLGGPRAGLIGACSHAGPGSDAAVHRMPSLPSRLPSDLTGLTTAQSHS